MARGEAAAATEHQEAQQWGAISYCGYSESRSRFLFSSGFLADFTS